MRVLFCWPDFGRLHICLHTKNRTRRTPSTRFRGCRDFVGIDRRVRAGTTSWGAIWAGLFVTLGVETLFTILMVGIFASFVHPGGATVSGLSFGIGIAVWFFLQTIGSF